MDKNKRQQPDLSNQAVRWAAYSLRDSFSLFELACLVHRLDPEAVHDDAVAAVKQHGGTMADVFASDHMGAVRVMYASPAMYFIPPVGDTLEVMKLATNPAIGYSVNKDRAKQIAQGLGYQWPVELEHHAPAPVVAENASNAPVVKPKAKRRTWLDVSSAYIVKVMQAGQYATCKELYRALEAKAGPDSPFDKGTGANRGSLFVREIAGVLELKTVQNQWQTLRELAKK